MSQSRRGPRKYHSHRDDPGSVTIIEVLGAVARSDPRPPDMRTVAGSIKTHVWQHSFVEIHNEIISTAILSLLLIQEGHLSVTGERMRTEYW